MVALELKREIRTGNWKDAFEVIWINQWTLNLVQLQPATWWPAQSQAKPHAASTFP